MSILWQKICKNTPTLPPLCRQHFTDWQSDVVGVCQTPPLTPPWHPPLYCEYPFLWTASLIHAPHFLGDWCWVDVGVGVRGDVRGGSLANTHPSTSLYSSLFWGIWVGVGVFSQVKILFTHHYNSAYIHPIGLAYDKKSFDKCQEWSRMQKFGSSPFVEPFWKSQVPSWFNLSTKFSELKHSLCQTWALYLLILCALNREITFF